MLTEVRESTATIYKILTQSCLVFYQVTNVLTMWLRLQAPHTFSHSVVCVTKGGEATGSGAY